MVSAQRLSQGHALALRAALLQGEAAAGAWASWLSQVDFAREEADPATFHVLPLMYRRLALSGCGFAQAERLKSFYLEAWRRSQISLAAAPAAVHALYQAGLTFVVLNTAPALRDHGTNPDPALPGRPLLSLNIWLPAGQVARAEAQLQPLGWARHQGRGGELVPLHTAAGAHLRLISRPFPGPRKPAAHALQLGAVPVTLGGVITPCIGPHDFILYAAYQAAQGEPERQLVRLADIAHALNSELLGAGQLIPRARELGVVLAARRVLAALCAQAPSPALRQALAALTAAQPTVRERLREASHIHPAVRRAVQRVRRL